jgi:RNA polymerase sigma-70 factor, ECF subfamily
MSTYEIIDWKSFRGQLKGFVQKHVKDSDIADDIVQDVFLKVQRSLSQLQSTEKIVGWIYRIAKNTITDHFRKRTKELSLHDLDWDNNWRPLNECVTGCLREAMSALPPKYREALQLAELENISQTDLAERLNISYSGAKSRVQRARQMLRDRMEEQYQIEMDKYGNVLVCENRTPCNCDSN